ncbi:MAG: branched-chain amino acid ABC transporter substrate-binding protein [Candidatus Omnitrophica bacterium]|nr:branched-chain amino acid ABC transporter substrate-binding protein [Candidatus Omnitrophota bacterium]
MTLLLLLAAGCGKPEPVIKIGFVGPLTGDQAMEGQDMMHGAQLAVEQANARGPILPGYTLRLEALDDQHSPTQTVAAAKRLVSDSDVVVIVGHLNSSCTMPASAVYHQAWMLQICPVSSNPQISRQGFENFFRTCPTDDLQGPAAASFAAEQLQAKRVFLLDDMTTYGRGLANEFIKKASTVQMEIIGHEGISQEDKDFVPLLTKIKSLNPDLIFFAGMYPQGALLIKQRAELGITSQFMGGDGLFDAELIHLATPQAAEGVYLTKLGADIHRIPTAQAFVKAFEAKFGPVGAYSSYAYEATNMAIWAIRAAGKKDRAAVLAAMKTLKDFPGIFGTQNFDEKGDTLIRDIGLVTVKNGSFVEVGTYTDKDGRFIFQPQT